MSRIGEMLLTPAPSPSDGEKVAKGRVRGIASRFTRTLAPTEQAARVDPTICELAKAYVAAWCDVHFQVSLKLHVPGMRLRAKPTPAGFRGLRTPPRGEYDTFFSTMLFPSLRLAQRPAQPLKLRGKRVIERKPRNAERRSWQPLNAGRPLAVNERCRRSWYRACTRHEFIQAESGENIESAATDEFAAHAMTRISASFPKGHRKTTLAQANAQCQTGQAATYNPNGFL